MSRIKDHELWLDSDGAKGKLLHMIGEDADAIDFSHRDLKFAVFRDMDLSHKNFNGTTLDNASFINVNLSGASFDIASAEDASFTYSNLHKTSWKSACLQKCMFKDCALIESSFRYADLRGANFMASTLDGVDLLSASLASTVGDGKYIKTLYVDYHHVVVYTAKRIYIGCQNRPIKNWKTITEDDLAAFHVRPEYIQQWQQHKKYILDTIEAYPAEPF